MDEFIRAVVQRQRTPTPQDVQQLRDHVATAPFNAQRVRSRANVRSVVYQGRQVQHHDDSVFVHLVQRTVADQQWTPDTTIDVFVRDLQRAAGDTYAHITVYDDGRGPVAGIFAPNAVPTARRGPFAKAFLYVAYAADRRSIITGYQARSLDEIRISENAQWLT